MYMGTFIQSLHYGNPLVQQSGKKKKSLYPLTQKSVSLHLCIVSTLKSIQNFSVTSLSHKKWRKCTISQNNNKSCCKQVCTFGCIRNSFLSTALKLKCMCGVCVYTRLLPIFFSSLPFTAVIHY